MNKLSGFLAAALVIAASTLVPAGLRATASAATPRCHAADVRVFYRATDAGAGHRYGRIVMVNTSGHACSSGGFGGLSYVGWGNGTQIGAAATRVGGWRAFVLRPGQRAFSPVDEVVAGNYDVDLCRPAHVDGFRVYIPNATRAKFVTHPTTGCQNAQVHLLAHKSFRKP
jgi:hypothetical protein